MPREARLDAPGMLHHVIKGPEVIKKILKHLDLWNLKARAAPRANAPLNNIEPHLDYSDAQLPAPASHCSPSSEAGGLDKRLYVAPEYPEAYSFDLEAFRPRT